MPSDAIQFEGPLELYEASVSQVRNHSRCVAWHPVLPARPLPAYRGRTVNVTREYLEAAASETRRYNADLDALGINYRRPILVAHDEGLRLGELVDFDVREYRGEPTLFVKGKWLPQHWKRIEAGEYERGSIHILKEHTDAQTGNTYGPFIDEFSVTEKPVVKDYALADLVDPAALAAVGLQLSEEPMPVIQEETPQPAELELQEDLEAAPAAGGASALGTLLMEVQALLVQVSNEIAELMGLQPATDGEGGDEELAASELAAQAPAPAAEEPEDDDNVVALSEDVAALRAELGRMNRVASLNTSEQGKPGDLQLGVLSVASAMKKAKSEGLTGIAAVNRCKELRGNK